jgi:hypothetical protein
MGYSDIEKRKEYARKYYRKHKDKIARQHRLRRGVVPSDTRRGWALRSKYGISSNDYQTMFDSQGGKCLICGRHQNELTQKLCVDHNHTNGKVRGLLCNTCNLHLGWYESNKNNVLIYLMRD